MGEPRGRFLSPLWRLAAEYAAVGCLVSLVSAGLGFYSAAFIIAEECYPELGLATIQRVHYQLFRGFSLAALLYGAVLALFFWFFAARHLRRLAALSARERERV